MKLGVIVGTTRQNRKTLQQAKWVFNNAKQLDGVAAVGREPNGQTSHGQRQCRKFEALVKAVLSQRDAWYRTGGRTIGFGP